MTNDEMLQTVLNQLSIDYNCSPNDFFSDEIIFTQAEKLEGRRGLPYLDTRLEIVTFGRGLVVNCSSNIIDYVKKQFKNQSKLQILNSSLICGFNPYYLPDLTHFESHNAIFNTDYDFVFIDKNKIKDFYKIKDLKNALQYTTNSERPEILGIAAYKNYEFAGIACASADSKTMWQIGVDVVQKHRGNGVAVDLVKQLSYNVLEKNVVPYYTTDMGNINSQKVAIKSGYHPAWSHCFRTRVKNNIITKTILSKYK